MVETVRGLSGPVLEVVQLELELACADFVVDGFHGSLMKALDSIDGGLLFNIRLEGDGEFQRCAAVVFGEGPDQTVAVAFLTLDGRSAKVEAAEDMSIKQFKTLPADKQEEIRRAMMLLMSQKGAFMETDSDGLGQDARWRGYVADSTLSGWMLCRSRSPGSGASRW